MRQQYDWPAILEWIRQTYCVTGWPVTVRQGQRGKFGVTSTSVMAYWLHKWIKAGLLESQGGAKVGFKPPHKEIVL